MEQITPIGLLEVPFRQPTDIDHTALLARVIELTVGAVGSSDIELESILGNIFFSWKRDKEYLEVLYKPIGCICGRCDDFIGLQVEWAVDLQHGVFPTRYARFISYVQETLKPLEIPPLGVGGEA